MNRSEVQRINLNLLIFFETLMQQITPYTYRDVAFQQPSRPDDTKRVLRTPHAPASFLGGRCGNSDQDLPHRRIYWSSANGVAPSATLLCVP
ncbi:hypothetical protein SAMN05216255_4467 [Pseudomonas segetis]|uniref:Uncharacterized protein n=1 Tax=Pseudomonas segetis TaxID=298908 RepID=A0A239JQY2_9PSED|nr:hypothetical protein SAMN05216255_4467 [Pseudomonas segetis]